MTSETEAFMLDSNVFSRVLDGVLPLPGKAGRRFLVIGVQADECRATRCPTRRAGLLRVLEEVAPELCLAASFCADIEGAGADQAEINDGSGRFEAMLARLRVLDPKLPKKDANQIRDTVIAETALKLGATLVSDDARLRQVIEEFGGTAEPSMTLA
jgi:predicted nucleic acid-binding protein